MTDHPRRPLATAEDVLARFESADAAGEPINLAATYAELAASVGDAAARRVWEDACERYEALRTHDEDDGAASPAF